MIYIEIYVILYSSFIESKKSQRIWPVAPATKCTMDFESRKLAPLSEHLNSIPYFLLQKASTA